MRNKSGLNWKLCAVAVVMALSACGGSGNDNDDRLRLNVVKVVGDSLSDSGTFVSIPDSARIASVQGSGDEPNVLWVERVTKAYDLAPLCPIYQSNGYTFEPNPRSGCTNYAVAGARINYAPSIAGATESPLSVLRQLKDAGAQGFGERELLLVDGGGNDVADLVDAFLAAEPTDRNGPYETLLGSLLPPGVIDEMLLLPGGPKGLGDLYMQTLADLFADTIKTHALNRGAQHVVVANIPTITYTPRFQAVLDEIARLNGMQARPEREAIFKGWIDTFNQRLSAHFKEEPRVRVFDLAGRFTDQIHNPGKYGLSNVTLPVCGAEGISVVPYRRLNECTASALSATTPPPGAPAGANWWQRFMFADGFHPTPYGHQLFGEQVIDLLDEVDWL